MQNEGYHQVKNNVSSSWDYTHPEQLVEIMMPVSSSPDNILSSVLKVLFKKCVLAVQIYESLIFKYIAESLRQITNVISCDK